MKERKPYSNFWCPIYVIVSLISFCTRPLKLELIQTDRAFIQTLLFISNTATSYLDKFSLAPLISTLNDPPREFFWLICPCCFTFALLMLETPLTYSASNLNYSLQLLRTLRLPISLHSLKNISCHSPAGTFIFMMPIKPECGLLMCLIPACCPGPVLSSFLVYRMVKLLRLEETSRTILYHAISPFKHFEAGVFSLLYIILVLGPVLC